MEADKNRKVPKTGPVPKSDYHTKYNHIISLDVGKQAAQDVSANKQYGNGRFIFVYLWFNLIHTWSVIHRVPVLTPYFGAIVFWSKKLTVVENIGLDT